jgi:two-component system sensor histidine kinase KdpD
MLRPLQTRSLNMKGSEFFLTNFSASGVCPRILLVRHHSPVNGLGNQFGGMLNPISMRISRKISLSAAFAAVLLVTVVFKEIAVINATTVGFAYLITVLLIAASWGTAESVLASIIATICFNYFFLPPVGTWRISDPENWVALLAFLISSLIASDLSNRAKRRAAEASTQRSEIERLYALSRSIMLMNGNQPIGGQIASELVRICEIPAVAIYDRRDDIVHYRGLDNISAAESRLKETALNSKQSKDEGTGALFAPITLGGQSMGSVAIQGGGLSNTALQALLNLIAIALENARSREMATRAQAARQSQEFKSTLMDGLAHEFKTPLTSIRAATTALLGSHISDAEQQHDLITIVDQEAERLSRLVTEATYVARLEAGKIQINRHWHSVDTLIERVLAQMEPQRDGRRIGVSIVPALPRVFVDVDLVQFALRQLIDNALKYSPRESTIQISSRLAGNDFVISVRNQGEPLSESESVRIFDKFYRGQNVRHQVAGTGMGLPVARDILRAHSGNVYLRSSDERGTEFVMTIPASTT